MINNNYKKNIKLLMNTSLPIVGTMISGTMMMLIDRICLSRYSPETLIASGPATYVAMGIMAFFISTANLTRTFVGQSNGNKNKEQISKNAIISIYASLLLGIILLILQPLIAQIPYLSDRPENIKLLEKEYLQIVPFYGFFSIINATIASIFIGILRTKIVMIVGIISHILDAIFSVGFVFGYFYLPKLGMAGSSVGTLVSVFVTTIIYIKLLNVSGILKVEDFKIKFTIIKENIKNYFKVALPSGISHSTEIFSNTAFIWIVGSISTSSMLALNIGVAINYLAIIPIIGLGIGTSTMTANMIGAKKELEANIFIKISVIISLVYVGFIGTISQFIPQYLTFAFITDEVSQKDKEITYALIKCLWVFGIGFVFSMIFSGLLEAKKNTKVIFWIRFIVSWGLSIPTLYFFSTYYAGNSYKVVDAWIIGGIYELLIGLAFAYLYYKTKVSNTNLTKRIINIFNLS